MNVSEEAVVFDCKGESLVGVITSSQAAAAIGVVVVVGGPQYRAGSHRYFVRLARALGVAGFPSLRFDYRGMGDSTGSPRSFEQVDDDLESAIDTLLHRAPQLRQVVLWGLCDGASAALMYLHASADTRVGGVCLLNPWVRSQASLARTHVKHYYLQRLVQVGFWRKLLSGKVAGNALVGLLRNISRAGAGGVVEASFQQRMLAGLTAFRGPVLLLLSEIDYTAKEFVEYTQTNRQWRQVLAMPGLSQRSLPGADHTLSTPIESSLPEQILVGWLRDNWPTVVPQSHESPFETHAKS